MSGAGDVNGDGVDDLLIGAPRSDSGAADGGVAYLVFGPVAGDVDLSAADARLKGERTGDHAGSSVSGAGDLDVDGFDDLLVGAPQYGNSPVWDRGQAYLVFASSL